MKYPIGVQQFEKLRKEDLVYVDKTALIYQLVKGGMYYFLSRPRRFGKSLLLSTIEAYFQGRKELFEGLDIERLETDWTEHAVLHFDLNAKPFKALQDLYDLLNEQLTVYEQQYGSVPVDKSPEGRLRQLIRVSKQKSQRGVVVLVDEYDKPILQAIGDDSLQADFRAALKAFYGTLKSADGDLCFAMLTGVTKFSKVSVFSDLNNLEDISMEPKYHDICGISEEELHVYFDEEVERLATENRQTKEEAYMSLRARYDGYHFCSSVPGIYNPFSLLHALKNSNYGSYWFSTGTPTYLVELLKEQNVDPKVLSGYEATATELDSIQVRVSNPIAVLYQSGYLTIKGYDRSVKLYMLDFPNEEVEEGFVNFLIPYYTPIPETESPSFIGKFVREVRNGQVDDFMHRLKSLMADTPYEIIKDLENHYQNVMFIFTKLMGLYTQVEYRTSCGRIDLLITTDRYVYVIELKLDSTAEEALEQINRKEYSLPFVSDGRAVVKIGANISSKTRNLEKWKVEYAK